MSYEYDLFLSYRRDPPVGEWVNNHFYPELLKWLPQEVNRDASVFKDTDVIIPGALWPQTIRNALLRSRCLLCIWSPDYFWHEWCLAEWKSMVARQRHLGIGAQQDTLGLICPVVFHDGQNFPDEVRGTEHADFREYNIPALAFSQTPRYVDFVVKMQRLACSLAQLIRQAPPWEAGWPIEIPELSTRPPTKMLRL